MMHRVAKLILVMMNEVATFDVLEMRVAQFDF